MAKKCEVKYGPGRGRRGMKATRLYTRVYLSRIRSRVENKQADDLSQIEVRFEHPPKINQAS